MAKLLEINLLKSFKFRVRGIALYESLLKKISIYVVAGYVLLVAVILVSSLTIKLKRDDLAKQIKAQSVLTRQLVQKEAYQWYIKKKLVFLDRLLKTDGLSLGNKEAMERVKLLFDRSEVELVAVDIKGHGDWMEVKGESADIYKLHSFLDLLKTTEANKGGFENIWVAGLAKAETGGYSFNLVLFTLEGKKEMEANV